MECNAAKLFKTLGECNRIRIIKMLQIRKCCVCELVGILGLSYATVSAHLKRLKEAGLLYEEKTSYWTYYSVSLAVSDIVKDLLEIVTKINGDHYDADKDALLSGTFVCERPAQ